MKKILQILFLFYLFLNAYPQNTISEIKNILNQINTRTPTDKLFLHLDRNHFHSGDTIRFQAFIRDCQTGIVETQSKSLYVLLLDKEHCTIDSARFRISYASSSGWLKVPENAHVGFYSIIAFTSDQMNYDPKFAFHTPIRIDRIGRIGTNSEPSKSMGAATVDLRFLPEGGTFIYGIRQRLAFDAVSSSGKSINVSGEIVNQDGKKISEMQSGKYGPGIIEFTPLKGETYYAKPVGEEFGNIYWPLPEPEIEGISLRVDNKNPGLLDIIFRTREVSRKEYFLTVTMNNILLFSRDIKQDTLFTASIKTADIPAGMAYVSIYNEELNPVAERLVFLNFESKMKIQIALSKASERAGGETELTINTTDDGGKNIRSIISVSVIDSSLGFYNGIPYPDIESAFFFDNEFYSNIPHSIKCMGLSNIDSKSVDNLMMTYGWRKYTLKETAQACQEKRNDNYDNLKISNPGKEKYGRGKINILSPDCGEVITLQLDENKETVLPFDSLDHGVRQVMILPDDDPSRNINPLSFQFPENKAYTNNAKLAVIDSSYSETGIQSNVIEPVVFNHDSVILIESVSIKGHRKKSTEFVAESANQFKYNGAYTLYSKDFEHAQFFEDIVYKLNPFYVDQNAKLIVLRAISYLPKKKMSGGMSKVYRPALIVVDGIQSYDRSYQPIAQLPAREISSITVIKGPQGYAKYGEDAANGVIIVTTKTGNRINGIYEPNEQDVSPDNHLKQVRIFRTEVEFYIPTKEEIELIPEYKSRRTLLWKSDVYLDGSGPVKMRYPNFYSKGKVQVTVNGASFTNLIGSESCTYEVR